MHELSLAADILSACRSRMNGTPARLECVTLAVGELSAVEPDLLRFAWEALTQGGPHAGARLEIEWHAARQVCERCGVGEERAPGGWRFECPRCAGPLRVEGGRELDLLRFSYQPAEPEGAHTP